MKKGLTEIVFILDKSGSMYGLTDDTIGGFNSVLEKQRAAEGEALVSTVLFNANTTVIHDRVNIQNVALLTREQYQATGSTAMLDAVGGAIHHIGNVHRYIREEDRPEHTLFVITTDGMENASHFYTWEKVRGMISHEKEKHGWEFIFLGANIDSDAIADRFNIDRDHVSNYMHDPKGSDCHYRAIDRAVRSVRACGAVDVSWSEEVKADYAKRKR